MTTETHKTYHFDDLISSIEERLPFQYAAQAGALNAALISVLMTVEVRDPELFQEIMAFEMKCETFMKGEAQIEY
jgi:hypothetical protein